MSPLVPFLKVLMVDASNGSNHIMKFKTGKFWGPVDLGLYLTQRYSSLNFGIGILAGSVFPGSGRLIINGESPCFQAFYISGMGGAGRVFLNLGITLLSVAGKARTPGILYVNRTENGEIEIEITPINLEKIWNTGRGGICSVMDTAIQAFGHRFPAPPQILATGPASMYTDFGAIGSAFVSGQGNKLPSVWAGRGGFGSALLRRHGIAAIVFGGQPGREHSSRQKDSAGNLLSASLNTHSIENNNDLSTLGTFGRTYQGQDKSIIAFNYRSIYWPLSKRQRIHKEFIKEHYLKQFLEETIENGQHRACGDNCPVKCKKISRGQKKDYAPYQSMGPLCGVFDQRAAELLTQRADLLGFDAVSAGGILAWLMECLYEEKLSGDDIGVKDKPYFSAEGFDVVKHSMHNALLGVSLLNEICKSGGKIDLREGALVFADKLTAMSEHNPGELFLCNSFGEQGWMVPDQRWDPDVLTPMEYMGKNLSGKKKGFTGPFENGRQRATLLKKELLFENLGFCRFNKSREAILESGVFNAIVPNRAQLHEAHNALAEFISSQIKPKLRLSQKNIDFISSFLKSQSNADNDLPHLKEWLSRFKTDSKSAAIQFWDQMHRGEKESLATPPSTINPEK